MGKLGILRGDHDPYSLSALEARVKGVWTLCLDPRLPRAPSIVEAASPRISWSKRT